MVEKKVNEDAGDGNVEPQRKSPARNAAVELELRPQGAAGGDENKWNNDNSENHMADEDAEINRADPAVSEKWHGADSEMVDDVGDEKGSAADESSGHAGTVDGDASLADGDIAAEQAESATGVERGVEGGMRKQVVSSQLSVVSSEKSAIR